MKRGNKDESGERGNREVTLIKANRNHNIHRKKKNAKQRGHRTGPQYNTTLRHRGLRRGRGGGGRGGGGGGRARRCRWIVIKFTDTLGSATDALLPSLDRLRVLNLSMNEGVCVCMNI